jgi:hypothetical protein
LSDLTFLAKITADRRINNAKMTILSKFKQALKLNLNNADARLRLQQAKRK